MNFLINKKFIIIFLVFSCLFSIFLVKACWAEDGPLLDSSKYPSGCIESGNCELNDFVIVLVRVSKIILGVVGSLALLMFIYGGVMFLISSGNSEKVTQAKQIIIGAVIGLVIVFTSYMIISFAAQALGIKENINILQSGWF